MACSGIVDTDCSYSPPLNRIFCNCCGMEIGRLIGGHVDYALIDIYGEEKGEVYRRCLGCADLERKGEDLLKEFTNNPPWEVIADWMEDNNRQSDADWIRKYRSGK